METWKNNNKYMIQLIIGYGIAIGSFSHFFINDILKEKEYSDLFHFIRFAIAVSGFLLVFSKALS